MNDQTCIDEILIERGQLGDHYALDELFGRYRGKAYMYALKMTKHTEEASDVVSEGFIRINRALVRFKANSSFSTWMCRILRNCFLDIRKKRLVDVACSLDAAMESDDGTVYMQPADKSESAYEHTARKEFGQQTRMALKMLPCHQEQLLLMYYEQELSYTEMASRLLLPAGTIKSRLHRAKLNLKDVIEKDPFLASLAVPN